MVVIQFIANFFLQQYPKQNYPAWAEDALKKVNIHLIHSNNQEQN